MESGTRGFPSDLVYRIAELTGVTPNDLFFDAEPQRKQQESLGSTIEFLQEVNAQGVTGMPADRDRALFSLIPFINAMYSGDVMITGSSLKGLQQDSNHEFIKTLVGVRKRRRKIRARVMFTHPRYAYNREFLENRIKGSIVSEVFQGIRWSLDRLEIAPQDIKLVKASPTCFSIFAQDEKEGIGLINPYPMMKQAFTSFSLIVRSVARPDIPGRAQSIFHNYVNANFLAPWNDPTGHITVALDKGLQECEDKSDELLSREAASLKAYLAGRNTTVREEVADSPAQGTSPGVARRRISTKN